MKALSNNVQNLTFLNNVLPVSSPTFIIATTSYHVMLLKPYAHPLYKKLLTQKPPDVSLHQLSLTSNTHAMLRLIAYKIILKT